VKTGISDDGELCESFVVYQEPDMNEASVIEIINEQRQPVLYVPPGNGLQAAVYSLPTTGGTIAIGDGPYYGDPLNPTSTLLVDRPVEFLGLHPERSGIASPTLVSSFRCGWRKLYVRPPGAAYGIRIYNQGNFLARCWFDNVTIGALNPLGTDGPITGLYLDGAGVLWGKHLTCANCTGDGLLVDNTAGNQPNTTLDFNSCTFNLNGNYGVNLVTSLTIASFKGGNMEDNGLLMSGTTGRELMANGVASIHIEHVDFERGTVAGVTVPSIDEMLEFQNCNAVSIIDNNFQNGSKATRAFFMSGGQGGRYADNRLSGWGAVGVLRISETCHNIEQGVNHIFGGGGWIEDYQRS